MTARAVDIATIDPRVAQDAIAFIAENLRADDMAELRATLGSVPSLTALQMSAMVSSRSFLILDRESLPIGIFGAAPAMVEGTGVAWLLGTDGMEREAFSIARQTRSYVEELHRDYPILWNHIDARNALSMKWLESAGFRIGDVLLEYGPERRPFFMFVRHRDV